jgi:hypothetical protein
MATVTAHRTVEGVDHTASPRPEPRPPLARGTRLAPQDEGQPENARVPGPGPAGALLGAATGAAPGIFPESASAPAAGDRTEDEVQNEHLSRRNLPPQLRRTLAVLDHAEPTWAGPAPASPGAAVAAAARAPRGGPALAGGSRRLDSSGRLNAKPLCDRLGWDEGTRLRFRPGAHGYVAEPTATGGGPGSLTGTVDAQGRVRLPHGIARRLDPATRGEVYARAVAGTLELYPAALLDHLIDEFVTRAAGAAAPATN